MSSIPEFYNGRSIFITGATGFLGKMLVEKLLRSCPDIKAIYFLIRPKRGREARERLDELLDSKLFEKLKEEVPGYKNKVIPIIGDILKEELGISAHEEKLITDEVSVVFHSAATIKFDEELKLSVEMNVVGVKKLLVLAKKMKNLEAFIHISTAYCNCDREQITETIYQPPLHPHKLIDAVEWMDTETLNTLTPKLIGDKPNTYTYTKALAEFLISEDCGQLPIAIVRPSIVGGTWQEPIPGWVDNFNGPTGLIAGIGKGILRIMKGDKDAAADIIPVDMTVNLMIAVGWYTAKERPNELKVYNMTSGHGSQSWGRLERMTYEYTMKNPFHNVARIPNPRLTASATWRDINVFFDHTLPAYVMDFCMWITRRKPIFVKIQERMMKAVSTLEYFTSNSWEFTNDNILLLLSKLSAQDKKVFNFDASFVDWPTYWESYCLGTKQFLMKEDLSELPAARLALKKLQRINYVINIFLIIVIWRLLINRVGVAKSLWDFLIRMAYRIFQKIPGLAKSS